MPSRRKSRTAAAVSTPTSSCASPVDAAMCGVATTLGSSASVQSVGGSCSNTSMRRAADLPRLERRHERLLVDELTARGVDDPDALLAAREPLGVEDVPRLRRRRAGAASGSRPRRRPRRASRAARRPARRARAEMNGSCATICMPNARARVATSWPMRPRPTTPSVLPRSSTPANFFFSHLRCLHRRVGRGQMAAPAPASAPCASSATLMLLAPGAFITTMPRAVAASRSTLSTPVPARAMTRSVGAAAISVARHLRRAAHDERVGIGDSSQRVRAADVRLSRRRSSLPLRAARPTAEAGRSSAMTIFIVEQPE